MITPVRAYTRHLRACGYCLLPGGKAWFDLHGLDWRSFVKYGIDIAELEVFDDFFAKSVIAAAKAEVGTNGN
jgi:hypothetical protein